MKKTDNLSESFGKTLIQSDLQSITSDVLESIIDREIFEEGILKDIPVVNSLIGLGKTFGTIRDYLFTKKILTFLFELSEVSKEKRAEVISKIDTDSKYGQSVGSKLLYVLDNAQDHISSRLLSKLFKAFLKEELSYREFCKAALIINRIDYYDLMEFLSIPDDAYGKNGTGGMGLEEIDNFLINAGLCSAETSSIYVSDQDDWKSNDKYVVDGGETLIYRTLIGSKIYKLLSSNKNDL